MKALSRHESEAAWLAAADFDALCALGAQFCRGEIEAFPGWLARALDDESATIAATLERLCSAGFLTLASQPGRPEHAAHDGSACVQRAFVTAFARPALADRLLHELRGGEIEVVAFARCATAELRTPVARASAEPVPVSLRGGVAYAFTGHDAFEDELACFADRVSSSALLALTRARYVCVHDRAWGRDDLLWRELERVACGAHG